MRRGGGGLLLAILLGLVVGPIVYWWWPQERHEPVTLVAVTPGSLEQSISATGAVEPRRKVLVTAEPGGRIAALYFEEQDIVASGQVLAKLDDVELTTPLRQMRMARDLAQAKLADAEATLTRVRGLYAKGYIARQEVEAAELQVEGYRTQVEDKQAAIQHLQAKLERTLIRAPIGGAITRKLVEVGGVVNDGPRSGGRNAGGLGQPLAIAEIARLDALEFHAEVDQTDVGVLKRGQRVGIALDAFPEQRFQGAVDEITLSNVEEVSGRVRYKVRVTLAPTTAPMRLGMTGTAEFLLARKDRTLTLPSAAVMYRGSEAFVFVIEAGRAWQRPIRLGLRTEEQVEVVEGLEAGAQVIQQGRSKVKDGQPVVVLREP
jgi:RND family efflux transporter MFP subunit